MDLVVLRVFLRKPLQKGKNNMRKISNGQPNKRNFYPINGNIDNKDLNISISNIDKELPTPKSFPHTENGDKAERLLKIVSDKPGSINFYRKLVRERQIPLAVLEDLAYETKEDVKLGKDRGKPIRNPGALFNWKVQHHKRKMEKQREKRV